MKIYSNTNEYDIIDQFVGTNIWVLAFYFDNLGTGNYAYVNILSRNGDTITFKRLSNAFVLGNATDADVWDFPWDESDVYAVICNFENYGSQDCEIYKFSISENDFEINEPIELLTTTEINDIIKQCYSDIIKEFES